MENLAKTQTAGLRYCLDSSNASILKSGMGRALFPFEYRNGIFLPELNLRLDPRRRAPLAFVSHAHADHACRHERVIATPETLALMRARALKQGQETALPFGVEREFAGGRIELFPAGHVLGSAQILVTTASGRLVYTGDFKLRPGLSCEPPAIRTAEVLIMETTYGLPRYRFPPSKEVTEAIIAFCRDSLSNGAAPVLMAYSLGKAQEVLVALKNTGLPIVVHETIARVVKVYRDYGIDFPDFSTFGEAPFEGKVVITPPSSTAAKALPQVKNVRRAAITGWGLDPSARYRFKCDAVFPLSDHADYEDLFRYVGQVSPRIVYTLHGYAEEFARDLRARGMEAWSLVSNNQLELPLAF